MNVYYLRIRMLQYQHTRSTVRSVGNYSAANVKHCRAKYHQANTKRWNKNEIKWNATSKLRPRVVLAPKHMRETKRHRSLSSARGWWHCYYHRCCYYGLIELYALPSLIQLWVFSITIITIFIIITILVINNVTVTIIGINYHQYHYNHNHYYCSNNQW